MKGFGYTYFLEKAFYLMRKLLVGRGTAKQRLYECEVELFHFFASDIPEDLKPLRGKIEKRLNIRNEIKVGERVTMTSFNHTIIYMKNVTASRIIEDIYDLYLEVRNRREQHAA